MGPLSLSIFMESGELRILPRADNPEQLSIPGDGSAEFREGGQIFFAKKRGKGVGNIFFAKNFQSLPVF